MERERFSVWFPKALSTLFGLDGILFLVNLIIVFCSWLLFVLVFFIANSNTPVITELAFMYIYKFPLTIGSFLAFLSSTVACSWTYWDAYVRLAKPDRRPPKKPSMVSMQKPFQKVKIPKELKKKPVMVSMQSQRQPQQQTVEITETKQTIETTVKKTNRGRPKGSKNKPKAQVA